MNLLRSEPALVIAFFGAVLAVGAAFLHITDSQQAALNGLILAAVGLTTRSQVSPAV
jgi:hypothetical protein